MAVSRLTEGAGGSSVEHEPRRVDDVAERVAPRLQFEVRADDVEHVGDLVEAGLDLGLSTMLGGTRTFALFGATGAVAGRSRSWTSLAPSSLSSKASLA